MKALITALLLVFIIGNIGAVDIQSQHFIDFLRALPEPGKPVIYENGVVFTFSSSHRRVGISFAHEGYARIHWFRHLMIPRDVADLYVDGRLQRHVEPNIDSGIMFHVEVFPENVQNLDYRLIIDGLWTADPLNPMTVTGSSGITASRVPLPARPAREAPPAPGTYRFSFQAQPNEIITVGGDFNSWDPFMYQLRETSPGLYTLTLPFPPGSFQYVFFHHGEQVPDPENSSRLFDREGRYVSVGVVN